MSSFSNWSQHSLHCQQGNVLFEALIGVLLTAIIGAGSAYVASRMAVSQHELRVEGAAVTQLRELLNDRGGALCGTTGNTVPMPGGGTAALNIACATAPTITVQPAITAASPIPASKDVNGISPITASVLLSNLGVNAEEGTAAIVVGTQQ